MHKEAAILIVDDEVKILSSFERLFEDCPFKTFTTSDPEAAFRIIEDENVKVILTDQRMPGVTGVELLKEVKEKNPEIIRVLFTGYSDMQAIQDSINVAEVYRFIKKPWNDQDLKVTVLQAIKHFDLTVINEQLVKSLEESNKELKALYGKQKEFSSTLSHELRTPLASIKSTIDVVLRGTPGPLNEDQTKFLTKTKRNVDRLHRLINDILDYSKLESGKFELEVKPNNIADVISEVIDIHSDIAREEGLSLDSCVDEDVPEVPFDYDKVNQVLSNLIGNSIKFADEGGVSVTACLDASNNVVKVCVRDTGVGIKQEDLSKLFGKFQQIGDPAKRQTGGTGLGLCICKEIVERHGGAIWVESQVGNGSQFYFTLPLQERM